MTFDDDDLTIRTTAADDHLLVSVIGDLDLESAPAMTAALKQVLGDRPVVVDLSGVEFMDSSGLGVLVGAHKDATALLLAEPGPRLQKIFKITKLHKVFALYPTVDEAIASLRAPATETEAPVESVVPGFEELSP
ncbi:STAS domain-containing protein [Kribbella sp. NPDC051587]|uniref:STAS domain-containing protein n=1 Tax=Kribbella sp. NPDC051587 TaxID=3364119 RepID=UPI00379BA716